MGRMGSYEIGIIVVLFLALSGIALYAFEKLYGRLAVYRGVLGIITFVGLLASEKTYSGAIVATIAFTAIVLVSAIDSAKRSILESQEATRELLLARAKRPTSLYKTPAESE